MTMALILGNKNYSSWSLRPWLLGQFCILDAMHSPLRLHFHGNSIKVGIAIQYLNMIQVHPDAKNWIAS
jgi:hypothetical protein